MTPSPRSVVSRRLNSVTSILLTLLLVLTLVTGGLGGGGIADAQVDEPVEDPLDPDIGGDDPTDTDTDAGDDAADGESEEGADEDQPPEDVPASEYYDEEQLAEWQDEADNELGLEYDVADLDAAAAHDIFVDVDEDGATVGADGTAQVGDTDSALGFDPEDNAEALAEWLNEYLTDGMLYFIDEVFNNMLETPYPENDGWFGILGTPIDAQYEELYDFMTNMMLLPAIMLMGIAFAAYVLFIMPWSGLLGRRVAPTLVTMFAAAILVLLGWNFATLIQMAANDLTMWLLPEGEELLQIEENDGVADLSDDNHELRSGPTSAVLALSIFGWNIGAVLILFHSARHFVFIFAPAFMPILLAGMYYGPKVSKASFSVIFWQYIALAFSNIPTAALFSMSFHVNFDFGFAGEYGELANIGMTMFLFSMGLFSPAIMHTAFFGGALFAIITKGSVLSAGMGRMAGAMPSASGMTSRVKQGGGYLNPVSAYKRRTSNANEQDRRRRSAAGRYGNGRTSQRSGGYYTPNTSRNSGYRTTATDGGYARMRNTNTTTDRTRPPARRGSSRGPAASRYDAGSVDARRRNRYRKLHGDDN